MRVSRPGWQVVVAAGGCASLVIAVGVVAMSLNPREGVSLADFAAVGLTSVTLAVSLLMWVGGSARLSARSPTLAVEGADRHPRDAGQELSSPVAVPRQLPAAVDGFVGRVAELAALTSQLDRLADAGATVVISAIGGMAGVGKTALAVCWAHQVADRFPDGHLYVNLRGYDPAGPPVAPAEALRVFLDAFEVPADRIPVGLDAQASLYRSIISGRRVLVVLDNAQAAAQVRPLLPGSPGCFVLVTSRTRLTSLIAAEGARPLTVSLLSVAESRELLARRLGMDRVVAEPESVKEIITLCAQLPLALSIVAARAATHLRFSLAVVARELRDARGGLQAFEGSEVSDDARAVFSWSYQRLDKAQARVFRLLALHPGPDVTVAAAGSMAELDVVQMRRTLTELARYHLIDEHLPGRFGFHDLLRAYATELVGSHDSDAGRHNARRRMLDHYLHTAASANLLLSPRWDPVALSTPVPGVMVEQVADHTAALAWFEAEYPVLLAAVTLAAANGDSHAWQLPGVLTEFFFRHGHWSDWAATEQLALSAAQRYNDRRGQADAHRRLGRALAWLGRYDEAHDHLQQALEVYTQLNDRAGQAESHLSLATVFEQEGKNGDALACNERAFDLIHDGGSARLQARALNNMGWFRSLLGQPTEGIVYGMQALTFSREMGDRRVESNILDSLGYAHHLLGEYQKAIDYFRAAILINEQIDDRHSQAVKLSHLADAYHAAGDRRAALNAWQRALSILDHLGLVRAGTGPGYADADAINAKLHHLDTNTSVSPD